MRKGKLFLFCLLLVPFLGLAQQTPQYSQFMLNNLGINPACAGEKGPVEILMGRREQWIGFPNAPLTDFVSATMSIGKKGFYRDWHGVGVYVEGDKAGQFNNQSFRAMYAYHVRLAHDYVFSAGVSVGVSIISIDGSLHDPADPALMLYPGVITIFPVISPGLRLYSRKLFFDLSAQQATNNQTVSIDGVKELGTRNILRPQFFFTVGRKYLSSNYAWTFTPSIQLRSTMLFLPTAELNLLVFYHKIIGIGISYRDRDAVVAMLQFHPTRKITLGIAYDYSISRLANGSSDSREIMFGFTPNAPPDNDIPKSRVAHCPGFDL
ncbi:MAG TPA: PorP/SprF family type IX secretion system membrane protein [Bacteroidia bacterium]|jgi:type IX secretion system PorP/SprF family membrane protein|nr:PorP/SprF family type IX secretion system membrane protein [Bacteroidia bacterium]